MVRYLMLRLVQVIPSLFGLTVILFALMRIGGDPVAHLVRPEADAAEIAAVRAAYGFDRPLHEQYLTSLGEVESRLIASEKWIDVPLKKQDTSHLNLDATNEGEPAEYYRNMFDLIALAFDADITRSVTFMLNREDGMGISDTFPLKLGLTHTHHNLSHAGDKEGQLAFAKYDLFLSGQVAHFLRRLNEYRDRDGSVLDNTIVLFGSGASTTHNPLNLPTLLVGGGGMGLKHGTHWRKANTPLSNVYLSILRSLGIEAPSFADSTGTAADVIFANS